MTAPSMTTEREDEASVKDRLPRQEAFWTHDARAAKEIGENLFYFAPVNRAPPPYKTQKCVEAIIDIAADGTLAGVELIYGMPPPPASPAPTGAGEAEKLADEIENTPLGLPLGPHRRAIIVAALRRTQPPQQTGAQQRERFTAIIDKWSGEAFKRGHASSWHYGELWSALVKAGLFRSHPTADAEWLSEEEQKTIATAQTWTVLLQRHGDPDWRNQVKKLLAIIDRQSDALRRMTQLTEDEG